METNTKLLVGWFCPWAQRAWIVALLIEKSNVEVVSDRRSVILDSDQESMASSKAQFMLKGELLGNMSVPAIISNSRDPMFGDSLKCAAWIWDNFPHGPDIAFDSSEAKYDVAKLWSDKIANPFYCSITNKNPQIQFDLLIENMSTFGNEVVGPYFAGSELSLVDIAVMPFAYRIITLPLFQIYRSKEISSTSLTLLDRSSGSAVDNMGLQKFFQWYEHCLALEAFQKTFPNDASVDTQFISKKLCDIYDVYANGEGLKVVNFEAK